MLYIDRKLFYNTAFDDMMSRCSDFVILKGDILYHTPFTDNEREVPADEIYGGPPAPYTVSVADHLCHYLNVVTGCNGIANKYYHDLEDGPGFFKRNFGRLYIVYDSRVRDMSVLAPKLDIRDETRALFDLLQKTGNTYSCKTFPLKYGINIEPHRGMKKLGWPEYSWIPCRFEIGGKKATYEQCVFWNAYKELCSRSRK